jgi:hypothetical protein
MAAIRITRRWVQITTYRSTRQCWTYDYAFNAGRPPAIEIEYGPALTELQRTLRRKYPSYRIEQAW